MTQPVSLISVILPAAGHGAELEAAVGEYAAELEGSKVPCELIVVADAATAPACERLVAAHPAVRCARRQEASWGAAVRAGLADAEGDLLAFVNLGRTRAGTLLEMLDLALAHPDVVLRANRRTRDTVLQRLGSLLFNLEARAVLGLLTWDVNGTPKVFPRRFSALLALQRDDELLDAEFAMVCQRENYPTLEVPINADPRGGEPLTPDLRSALRMYLRLPRLRALGKTPR
jgi:hypothetical protein